MNEKKKAESVTVRMDEELKENLNKLREGTERTLSQQVRLMLKLYLQTLESEKK